ncbi:hypothetical protein ACF1AX_18895 [Streptomyces sp. NPDC014802]|uniref:hypothetical protein n=1 Tax=Streptomyces sp. NPDC014802 TaxID=3364917 RepID=UPI0037002736
MADAQITLTYSRNVGVVAIATGEQYKSAESALNDAGFRRGETGVYQLTYTDEAAVRATLAHLAERAEVRGIQVAASSRRFIGDTAQDIARCLPGQWDTQVEIYSHPVWKEDLVPYLWDCGELARVVHTDRIPYAATLTDPISGTTLLLVEHPGHQLSYLVGAFVPEPFGEGFDDPHAPRSITVPPFPGRAAQVIIQRYLPAYDRAVHERRITHVAEALDLIQSEWGSWNELPAAPPSPAAPCASNPRCSPRPSASSWKARGGSSSPSWTTPRRYSTSAVQRPARGRRTPRCSTSSPSRSSPRCRFART